MTKVALAFMKEIADAGYQAMLYGNIRTISEMVDLTQFEDYGLWFAYYSNEIYIPYKVCGSMQAMVKWTESLRTVM